jgi:uncharacterized protein
MDLRNKIVVVTGASSGIGEAIARQCARRGARVVLAARSYDRLRQLADELDAAGSPALVVPTDVTQDVQVARLASATRERFGHADVVVNNAGFGALDRFVDADMADLRDMFDVNLYGSVLCTNIFLPDMLARGSGHLVFMSSLAGLFPFRNMAFYGATKFALVGIASTLMLELDRTGVDCTLLCPGPTQTNFMRRAEIQKFSRATRLVPWITADEVAGATVAAIERGSHGRVIIPWQARPLVAIGSVFPRLARYVLQMLG